MSDPLVIALETTASLAVQRGQHDVYRFCMSAAGHLMTDAVRHRPMAEAVLDGCITYMEKTR